MFVKNKIIIIIAITIFIFGCGKDQTITSVNFKPTTGLYSNVQIENNILHVQLNQNMNIRFEYYNWNNNTEKYYGWLAGNSNHSFDFHLPVKQQNAYYALKIRVENEKVYQDTVVYFTSSNPNYNFFEVHYINVQQGDGIYIKTPEGQQMMIDGGYGTRGDNDLSYEGYGQPLALNYVRSINAHDFKYLIETHRHGDHYGGLYDIRDASDMTYDYYFSNSNLFGYQEGQFLNLDSQVHFQILNIGYPPNDNSYDQNNTSIVIRSTYQDAEYLFTGDAEGSVQSYLYTQPWSLSSDLLKIAHHGSSADGTSDNTFLKTVLNQYAKIGILSFGTNNSYGHPKVLSRFNAHNIFGTCSPSSGSGNPNHHFNMGNIITYTDGKAIIVTSKK